MPTAIRHLIEDLHGCWEARDYGSFRTTMIVLNLTLTGQAGSK